MLNSLNEGSLKVLYKGIAHTSIFIASIIFVGFIIYIIHNSKTFRIKTPIFEIERHSNVKKTRVSKKKKLGK